MNFYLTYMSKIGLKCNGFGKDFERNNWTIEAILILMRHFLRQFLYVLKQFWYYCGHFCTIEAIFVLIEIILILIETILVLIEITLVLFKWIFIRCKYWRWDWNVINLVKFSNEIIKVFQKIWFLYMTSVIKYTKL